MDIREKNVTIFEDTKKHCKNHATLKNAISESNENQIIYKEEDVIPESKSEKEKETKIIVSKKRSFEAASAYRNKKVCVHNFASATNPGGGVVRGSTAQEESLCRISTLYFNLSHQKPMNEFYQPHCEQNNAIYNDDCIYTPEVIVFKDDSANPSILKEKDWYSVNVLTCAAPNLREKPSNSMNPNAGNERVILKNQELLDIHIKRGRRILDIARLHGNDVVILGAFGCGAFKNNPEIVAEAYTKLLEEYDGVFETIEFAVYCSPKDTTNFDVFQRKIKAYLAGRKK